MATTEQATEVVNKRQQLVIEQAVMTDFFHHAARSSQCHSGDSKLNFRQAERHISKEFSGKEWMVRRVRLPDVSVHEHPGSRWKGGEPLRVVCGKDMNADEVRPLESIYCNVADTQRRTGIMSYHHHG